MSFSELQSSAKDDIRLSREDEESSEIQSFYEGKHIFITGASGFLGCLLVEKLLRACPGIQYLYLLMRDKKGKTPSERLQQLFDNPIYDLLKSNQPDFYKKIIIINGDCALPNLGLKADDESMLQEKINVVFHLAATVRFDEKLRKAFHINVKCTRDLLTMATNMKNLKAFLYISTAYSNCVQSEIDEIYYDPPMAYEKLSSICDCLNDEQLDLITPNLIGPWPNTYTFTKAIAENLVKNYVNNIPVAILRPSIVISTYAEPISGWINNYYGPVALTAGAGKGVLHCTLGDPSKLVDPVPVDYVINASIVIVWQTGSSREQNFHLSGSLNRDSIYNYVCSTQKPLTWTNYIKKCTYVSNFYPQSDAIAPVYFYMIPNYYLFMIFTILTQIIPGLFFDTFLILIGKKPRLLKIYKKLYTVSLAVEYFTTRDWSFSNNNVQALWKIMNKTDQRLFVFDLNTIEWDLFIMKCAKGARVYLLNDPLETLDAAKRKQVILKIVHYGIIIFVICYLLYKFLCLFSF